MPSVDPLAEAAPVFAALGDPTRLSLLQRLSAGEPRSIAALSAGGPMTRQAVTKHLRVLEEAGLVHSARFGRESRYAYQPAAAAAARRFLDGMERVWEARLGRFKAFVEQGGADS